MTAAYNKMIYGWDNLQIVVNAHRTSIVRWIKIYGFPRGSFGSCNGKSCLIWELDDVARWMSNNRCLVTRTKGLLCAPKNPIVPNGDEDLHLASD